MLKLKYNPPDDRITRLCSVRAQWGRVVCLRGHGLLVVDVNLIGQEAACVLNTAGRTPPVHAVPVPPVPPVSVSDFHLSSCCSVSHFYTCCASLLSLFHFCLYNSLLLVDLKNLYCQLTSSSSSSSPPLLLCVFSSCHRSTISTDTGTNSSNNSAGL